MNKITNNIYLGDIFDVIYSPQALIDIGITATLNMTLTEEAIPPYPIKSYRWGIIDGEGNKFQDFLKLLRMLRDLVNTNEIVLAHCYAGVSRSPTVVATYLALTNNIDFDKALLFVQKCRPIVMPNKYMINLGRIAVQNCQGRKW